MQIKSNQIYSHHLGFTACRALSKFENVYENKLTCKCTYISS